MNISDFDEKFGKSGDMISRVDLISSRVISQTGQYGFSQEGLKLWSMVADKLDQHQQH